MAEAAKPRRIIDVSNPGETAPHASARPVITNHTSVQDPMVSNAGESISVTRTESPAPQTTFVPIVSESAPTPVEVSPEPDVKQLVHDKTYFSPVSQPPHRHGISWLLVFASLTVIAGILAYFMLIA